tara:strand:- start:524 stop:1126 length:603 start_codon:yes stop_codon:yes gene_type:complete
MDNPLFLVTKGLRAKKKRLAAGGGGGGGITVGTKTTVSQVASQSQLTHSSCQVTITDMNSGAPYTDSTGITFLTLDVDDLVASGMLGVTPFFTTQAHTGTSMNSGGHLMITFEAERNPTGASDTANLTLIHNTVGSGVNVHVAQVTRFPTRMDVEIDPSAGVGALIFKVAMVGGTTDTDANVINKNAVPSDAFYFRMNVN